jgi:iron complex outermembrane recepter protein
VGRRDRPADPLDAGTLIAGRGAAAGFPDYSVELEQLSGNHKYSCSFQENWEQNMRLAGKRFGSSGLAALALLAGRAALAADDLPGPAVAAAPAPAPAETPAASAKPYSGELEQITVTANKRVQQEKDVPTSISVVGGTDLEEHHVVDYDDITRSVPGVSFGAGAGFGQTNIEIRGISSTTGSATVGTYLDDVPITTRNTYDGAEQPKLLDIDRIEVLRGPQGTLYGASSEGGTIRFITNQPDLTQFSANVISELSGTEHGGVNYDEQGVVNYPVVDGMFGLRAAIEYGDNSGWIDNYTAEDSFVINGSSEFLGKGPLDRAGVNDERNFVFRLTGKYQVDPDLTITPVLFLQRVKDSDASDFFPAIGLYQQTNKVDQFIRDTMFVPSVTVNDNLGFADLTSVTSYFWRQNSRQTDGTFYNDTVFAVDFLDNDFPSKQPQNDALIGTLASPVTYQTTYGTTSQEFRFTSEPSGQFGLPIKWVGGVFWSDQWDTHRDYEISPGLGAAFKSIYGVSIEDADSLPNNPATFIPLDSPTNPNLYANDLIYFASSRYDERQYAAFGQIDVDILPDLHGSAGLRYDYARVSYTRVGGGFYDLGNISPYVQNTKYYPVTPKFSLTYDLSDTSSIYTSVAKGFRLGGPTGPTPIGPNNPCQQDYINNGITNPPVSYGPDKLWSFEAGTKTLALGNTLSVNAALYYVDWQGIQQTVDLPICGFNFTTNVGNAESYGTEAEILYKPPFVQGLIVGVSGGGDRSVITSTINPNTAQVGESVLNTPDWTLTLKGDYNWDIRPDVTAFVRSDYDLIGQSHGSFKVTDPNFNDPFYGVANASVGIDFGSLQMSLFAKNFLDNQTIIQRPQINTVITGYTVRPLTVGLNIAKQF